MKVYSLQFVKGLGTVVSGVSPWHDELKYRPGDVVVCGDRAWTVSKVDRVYQGCFGVPKDREHCLMLEPIGHNEEPNIGDELVVRQ